MMLSDNHVHTAFSTDSQTPMLSMLARAKELALPSLCFTDHMDYQFPSPDGKPLFVFDPAAYFAQIKALADTTPGIAIRTGVELGLKKDVLPEAAALTKEFPFDFVIGSTHLVDNIDPYEAEYWDAYGEKDGIRRYYEATLENILAGFDFDVYGHIDYIIRYCPTIRKAREQGEINEAFYQQAMWENKELIDEILLNLIQQNCGIEVNTGGLKYQLGHPNPHEDILKRYRALGGSILTIGSDAHEPKHLAFAFDRLPGILGNCGFTAYTEFHHRQPVSCPLF